MKRAAPSTPGSSSPPPAGDDLTMVAPAIAAYAEAHTVAESAAMRAIADETHAATDMAIMMVGPLEAALLRMLVRVRGVRRIVEVGTFTGYSAMAMAEGLADDGAVVTLDINETWAAIARKHWATSPHGRKITLKIGQAVDTLPGLAGPFELAFIDADKHSYPAYWDLIVPKMAAGGLVVVDNVLAGGEVVAPDSTHAREMAAFNDKVMADARVESLMLPLRDGVTIARVRGA
jgi:caffeoyl-CoA O-methyltransferase